MQNSSFELSQKTPSGFISFGKINGVFGFRGEAKFFLHNRNTDLLGEWIELQLFDGKSLGKTLTVKLRASGKKIIGTIKGIEAPEEVAKLINIELLLKEEDLPLLQEDEFYHHDLLGLEAFTKEGEALGKVIEISSGTVAVLTISGGKDGKDGKDGKEEYYIPFLSERVLEITPKKSIIVVI